MFDVDWITQNCPPTGRLKPKQKTRNPIGRRAPERRRIERNADQNPSRKSNLQQEDLTQKGDSLRKMSPDRKTKTQTGNQKPDSTKTKTGNQRPNSKTCPPKEEVRTGMKIPNTMPFATRACARVRFLVLLDPVEEV